MEQVIAHILRDVGIGDIDNLREVGSLEAINVICKKQNSTCVNMLYALESVIRGIEMDQLSEKDKEELRSKYEQMLQEKEVSDRAP